MHDAAFRKMVEEGDVEEAVVRYGARDSGRGTWTLGVKMADREEWVDLEADAGRDGRALCRDWVSLDMLVLWLRRAGFRSVTLSLEERVSRTCCVCGEVKGGEEFALNGRTLSRTCLACVREKIGRWKKENAARKAKYDREYMSPERTGAYAAVARALRDGDLVQAPECGRCRDGRARLYAYHRNGYERPLDVEWLCPGCMAMRHGRMEKV